ncbi:hypothetical protein TNCV_4061441 [Trichonephila clavipes]|nr:hypothetical protein TNCV_4061441 [Trichonephila clavipes]
MPFNKSSSEIKQIILDVRFPNQKNWRVTFQGGDRARLTSEHVVLFTATLHPQLREIVLNGCCSDRAFSGFLLHKRNTPTKFQVYRSNSSRDIMMRVLYNNRRTTSPLERWEAPDPSHGVLPENWGGIEQIRTVTCMLLKAKANDRRTNLAPTHVNFRGP